MHLWKLRIMKTQDLLFNNFNGSLYIHSCSNTLLYGVSKLWHEHLDPSVSGFLLPSLARVQCYVKSYNQAASRNFYKWRSLAVRALAIRCKLTRLSDLVSSGEYMSWYFASIFWRLASSDAIASKFMLKFEIMIKFLYSVMCNTEFNIFKLCKSLNPLFTF